MIRKQNDGFTLVELMVALALSGLVIAAVYKTLSSQQTVYHTQERVVSTQQELRTGLEFLVRELRMAGYNPTTITDTFGITAANVASSGTPASITVVSDTNPLGTAGVKDAEETITYTLSNNLLEKRKDGVAYDSGNSATFGNVVLDNVSALDFVFLGANGWELPTPLVLANIKAVQIGLVVRSASVEKGFTDKSEYKMPYFDKDGNAQNRVLFTPSSAADPTEKQRRHRLLTTTVWMRNL